MPSCLLLYSTAYFYFVFWFGAGPTVDEFKKLFTIHNDLTPDEEAKFRRECLIPKKSQGVPNHEGLH